MHVHAIRRMASFHPFCSPYVPPCMSTQLLIKVRSQAPTPCMPAPVLQPVAIGGSKFACLATLAIYIHSADDYGLSSVLARHQQHLKAICWSRSNEDLLACATTEQVGIRGSSPSAKRVAVRGDGPAAVALIVCQAASVAGVKQWVSTNWALALCHQPVMADQSAESRSRI